MTNKPYKKSCIILQGYNNIEKTVFWTQALIIQQYNQRLLFWFAPILQKQEMKIIL